MKWIDGTEINIKQSTGQSLCEKLAVKMWDYKMEQRLKWADFMQVTCFLIDFDTELTTGGIFTFLENSIGHYSPNII